MNDHYLNEYFNLACTNLTWQMSREIVEQIFVDQVLIDFLLEIKFQNWIATLISKSEIIKHLMLQIFRKFSLRSKGSFANSALHS